MRDGFAGEGQAPHTPLTISLLEPALLILLKEQARHGYTLLSDLGEWGMDSIHPSVIYRTLRELEGLDWVQSDWERDQTKGPPRRNYRITARGDEALRNWKTELVKTRELISQLLNRADAADSNERSE